jgi:DNA-binding transcriptional LysR family regulator
MRKLTTTSLELAVWIARLGSFTAAAERMHTTQPAVSARVKELEDTLGHKLFVRQGRGVELTPEGREFVIKAESVLRQLDELSVSFSKASLAGVIRLGMSTICLDLLAAVSIETSRTMPLVSYEVETDRAAPLLYRLESRKIDVAMVSGPVDAHKFRIRSLGFDRMLWVTSPGVRNERANAPRSERLKGLPIWCVHADSFYWNFATTGLRALGADLVRVNALGQTVGVARVVAAGAGIGLVSESLVQGELGAGTLVPVPDLDVCGSIELSVVTMADSSSTIVDEVVAAALANSPFRRTPFEA